MESQASKCKTAGCLNISHHLYCLSCSAEGVKARSLQAAAGVCMHGHSVTGSYDTIKRLLPEYMGSDAQPGFMLDVCKACLQVLHERPYNPIRRGTVRGH